MRTAQFRFAIHRATGECIHVDKADRGLDCGCYCTACDGALVAAQGPENAWHFRHYVKTDCPGAMETILHERAKKILGRSASIQTATKGTLIYQDARIEKGLDRFRPDVSAVYAGKPLYFEVTVSHKSSEEKRKYYQDNLCRAIEVKLSHLTGNEEEQLLEQQILYTPGNTVVMYWEPVIQVTTESEWSRFWTATKEKWIAAGLIVVAYLLFRKRGRR